MLAGVLAWVLGFGPGGIEAGAQSPLTVQINPTADAFVRAAAPTLNYGGAGALAVSGEEAVNGSGRPNGLFDTLLRFPLGGAAAGFDAAFGAGQWSLSSATLRLTEVAAPNNPIFNRGVGDFDVHWMASDAWVEGTGYPGVPSTSGVVYNDLPSLLPPGGTVALGTFINMGANSQQAFDLSLSSPLFLSDLRSGGEVSFYLTAASPDVGFTFYAQDWTVPDGRPVLELTAIPEPRATALALLAGALVLVRTLMAKCRGVRSCSMALSARERPGNPLLHR